MPSKCANFQCSKRDSKKGAPIKGVSGNRYCSKACMKAAGDEQDSKNAERIKADNDRNSKIHSKINAEKMKQDCRAQFDDFIKEFGITEVMNSTHAEKKGQDILYDRSIFATHPDERLRGKHMVQIVADAVSGKYPFFLYLGESGRDLWAEAFRHLTRRGSLKGKGARNRPVLLWSDGSTVTQREAITILDMESVWLCRDPHKQNTVQIEEALQRHFHTTINLPSSKYPVGRGWRNVGAGSSGFHKMMEEFGYSNAKSGDIEDDDDDEFLDDGELPTHSDEDDSDEDFDNQDSKGKGLADQDKRLHGVYLTYSFKVHELLKSGDLVVDSRTAREAKKQQQIPGLSSTKKKETRPAATTPYMRKQEFNRTMEAATTPVVMVARSSADEGQQSGEKRPAFGLSDRVDKKAKTQHGILQFFGKGKEAMK